MTKNWLLREKAGMSVCVLPGWPHRADRSHLNPFLLLKVSSFWVGRRRLNSSRVVEPPASSVVASTILFLLQTSRTGDLRFLANPYHKLLTCLSGPVPAELMGRNGRNEKGCSRGASFLRHGCSSHPFPLGGREVSRTSLNPG